MARIISGGFKGFANEQHKEIPNQIEPSQEEAPLYQRLGSAVARGILNPLESATSFLSGAVSPLRSGLLSLLPEEAQKKSQQYIEKFQNRPSIAEKFSGSQVAPQSYLETAGQRFLEQAPINALFGTPALARSALGSLAGGAVERAGFEPGLGDIAQIATDLGLGLIPKGTGFKIPKVIKKATEHSLGRTPTIAKAQKIAQKALEDIKVESFGANPIRSAISHVKDSLKSEVNSSTAASVGHALETIKKNIGKVGKRGIGKINPNDALKLRHSLYDLGRRLPKDDAARYVQPLTKGINDFFSWYGSTNPSFYNALTKRDQLTQLRHMGSFIDDFAQSLPKAIMPGVIEKILGIAKHPIRLVQGITTNPQARKHYFDVVKAAAENNPALFIKNVEKLLPFTRESLSITEEPKKRKIISGGLSI